MYSLIVWHALDDLKGRTLSVSQSRFLEYTDPGLSARLKTLSDEAINALKEWPMLLMTEGQSDEEAHIVFAESIRLVGEEIVVRLREGVAGPILNEQVWKLRKSLDIADWEFTRSHWAVKEVDLVQALTDVGYPIPSEIKNKASTFRLMPSRAELLALRDRLALLGHRQIDDIVMLAGIAGLDAGRSVGSREDRANAIIQFAIDNPGAITSERQLLTSLLEKKVAELAILPSDSPSATASVSRNPRRVFVVHGCPPSRIDRVRLSVNRW